MISPGTSLGEMEGKLTKRKYFVTFASLAPEDALAFLRALSGRVKVESKVDQSDITLHS